MRINPEILRHFWLDFSLQRTVMMPVILLIIFGIGYTTSAEPAQAIVYLSTVLYFFLIFIWGAYRTSSTVLNDINDQTWDYQRLSSLSPWSLTFGTIFGSSLYVWYGAVICLVAYIIHAPANLSGVDLLFTLSIWVIGGIACLAVMTLIGMQPLQSAHRSKRHNLIGFRILAILAGYNIAVYLWAVSTASSSTLPDPLQLDYNTTLHVYGYEIVKIKFFFLSLIAFAFWAVFGVYRSMRSELKMRTSPVGWTAFLIFLFFYCGGINIEDQAQGEYQKAVYQFFLIGFFISLITFYLMFFSDFLSSTRYRMMGHHFAQGNFGKGWELVPRWSISFFFAALFAIIAIIVNDSPENNFALLAISALLFMVRDAAILNFFSLAQNNKRALMATLFYLALFYILAPMIFRSAEFFQPAAFFPMVPATDATHLLPIAIQALVAVILVAYRWTGSKVQGIRPSPQTA